DVRFFFSSRRRHTRLQGDWSSDVCSSDLEGRLRTRCGSQCTSPLQSTLRTLPSLLHRRARTRICSVAFPGRGGDLRDRGGGGLRSEERRVGKEWGGRWGGR